MTSPDQSAQEPTKETMTTERHMLIECAQVHPALCVTNVSAAAAFYEKKLGFTLAFTQGDPPSMAGLILGNVQIFLEQGTASPKGCSVYFVVGNADELYEFHRAAGVDIVVPPGDRH